MPIFCGVSMPISMCDPLSSTMIRYPMVNQVFFDFIVAINGINLEPKASMIFVGVLNSIRRLCFNASSYWKKFCKGNFAKSLQIIVGWTMQLLTGWCRISSIRFRVAGIGNDELDWIYSLLDAFGIVFFSGFMNSFSTTKSPQSKLTEGSAQARWTVDFCKTHSGAAKKGDHFQHGSTCFTMRLIAWRTPKERVNRGSRKHSSLKRSPNRRWGRGHNFLDGRRSLSQRWTWHTLKLQQDRSWCIDAEDLTFPTRAWWCSFRVRWFIGRQGKRKGTCKHWDFPKLWMMCIYDSDYSMY